MLDELAAFCGTQEAASILGLFLAGLGGGALHCGPMCGPLILAQAGDRLARREAVGMCERHRLAAGLLLPYHAGRLITYSGLGAAAGGLGGLITALPGWHIASSLLLALAAVFFLARALAWLPGLMAHGGFPNAGRIFAVALSVGGGEGRGFLLGILAGFLPCGLLYAALTAAAAHAGAAMGALAMLAFGLGTTPILTVIGFGGARISSRVPTFTARLAPVLSIAVALLLGAIAARPFLFRHIGEIGDPQRVVIGQWYDRQNLVVLLDVPALP